MLTSVSRAAYARCTQKGTAERRFMRVSAESTKDMEVDR
jgi:hypothetical protein